MKCNCKECKKSKKGKNGIKIIKGLLGLAGGVFVTGIGAMAVASFRNNKKMSQHANENNTMFATLFQKEDLEIKPETQNAYITVICSLAKIKVPKPEKECMNIDITSLAGKVDVALPDGVTVKCDNPKYSGLSKEGAESSPVINLVINDRFGFGTKVD